ncbi:MAG: hypothetical protein E6R04_08020 [Spirochaetes bacterium]|nr:MAG: hypothetical protein E6R04_08020 [Spirochaetota bacterium]
MTEPEWTTADLQHARHSAMHALETRGWQRVEFAGLYQPIYRSPDGARHVQLVRILDTPRFEVAPVAEPEPSVPPRRLDYPVERCTACGMGIVRARQGDPRGEPIVLDPGYAKRGRYRLERSLAPNDVPVMVAIVDRSRGFGHVAHAASCRSSSNRSAGRPEA